MSKATRGRSGGLELAEEVIAKLADKAERGYDLTRLKRVIGRPRMGSLPASTVQVRLEPELLISSSGLRVVRRLLPANWRGAPFKTI